MLISSILDAVEPIAPNIKAYIRKPSTKNNSIYASNSPGIANIEFIREFPPQ